MELASVTMLGVLILIISVSIILYQCLTNGNRQGRDTKPASLIPGWSNKPAHPQLGDLGIAMSCGSLYSFLEQRHKEEDSPVLGFWWNTTRVVSVCSSRAFKETEHLYNRPCRIFDSFSVPLNGAQSIQNINDLEWEKRKRVIHKTLRGEFVVTYVDEFQNIAEKHCSRLKNGEEIELVPFIQIMTLKGILFTCLGNMFDDNELQHLSETYHFCKCEMDKRLLKVPPEDSQQERDYQAHFEQLKDYMHKMIMFYRETKSSNSLPFLDALLSSSLPEETIMDDMITILGGYHTSAYYLSWTIYFLAHHPEAQSKLASEVKENLKDRGVEQLKSYVLYSNSYLRQVLDESLRLSGTAPLTGHYSIQDTEVEGYLIPAHTPIIQCMGMAMTDDSIWSNPLEFNPDRFSPGTKAALRGREFRPFGVSIPRRCPSNQFTYTMVSVFLCKLIKEFIISPIKVASVEKKHGFTTSPNSKIFIVTKQRQ